MLHNLVVSKNISTDTAATLSGRKSSILARIRSADANADLNELNI